MSLTDDKNRLRAQIKALKASFTAEQKATASKAALKNLEEQTFFKQAQTVLLYWSLPDEVETQSFAEKWAMEKIILLPAIVEDKIQVRLFTSKEDMETGAFGIVQPKGEAFAGKIDLTIIPGVAFDQKGNRLGRGKGFYDGFLVDFSGIKCGLCWDFQRINTVPHEAFDIRMDVVFSEKNIFESCP